MRWGSVVWLWMIPVAIAAAAGLILEVRDRRKRLQRFADSPVLSRVAPGLDYRRPVIKTVLWGAALVGLALALARPQGQAREELTQSTGMDIFVVLDISNSMETEDVSPSRLKLAKRWLGELIGQLKGDRVGLVVFAGSAHLAVPLTTDLDYILENLEIQSPKMVQNQGTDIGSALEVAKKAIERGAEEVGAKATEASSRAVILISDGEDHEGRGAEAAGELKKLGVRLYTLGVGSEQGGPIPDRDETGALRGYKRDRSSGQAIVSRFDSKSLEALTQAGDGRYWTMSLEGGERDEILSDAGSLKRGEFSERKIKVYAEFYQWPLGLGLILIALELSLWVRGRQARQKGTLAASVVGLAVLALFSGISGSPQAYADPVKPYLKSREGKKLLEAGDLEGARARFSEARKADPERPDLIYNEGTAGVLSGDNDGASQRLEEAAGKAKAQGNSGLEAKSRFNLGISREKAQDVPGALKAYVDAIDAAQAARDPELEARARRNLRLLYKSQEQKQQQQKNDSDQQKEQKQQQQQKADAKPEEKENDQKKYQQQPQQKKFQSQKLSKEDADRVLSELAAKEKELQGKLREKKGRSAQAGGKDW